MDSGSSNDCIVNSRLRLVLFAFAIALKFWLIWDSEIVDARDDPHEYVLQILYPANGGLAYPPGLGLVGQFFQGLHLPFRLALEIFFVLAITLVIRALFCWPWQNWLALGLFTLGIFDPAPIELFSHLFSDPTWMVEILLGTACFVLACRQERRFRFAFLMLSLAFFGLSLLTRSTAAPLILATILFSVLALVLILSKFPSPAVKSALDRLAVVAPTIILGLCLIFGVACRYNFLHHGYVGLSYVDCSEYKQFYLTLQSVGDPDGPTYFPIDEHRRQLIAQAGPTSRWFVEQLEKNDVYKQAGRKHYGISDIPSGWFHWATYTATLNHGDYLSAFSLFHKIEDEIAAAHDQGTLKVRTIASMPDSRLSLVAAAFPHSLRKTIGMIRYEPPLSVFAPSAQIAYTDPDFTTALTRRAVTPSPLREHVRQCLAGLYRWIYNPALFYLFLATLLLFLGAVLRHWKQIESFSLDFLGQQLFALLFFVFLLWYALFDASGMPSLPRYLVYNHLLLVPLLAYYLTASVRLLHHQRL